MKELLEKLTKGEVTIDEVINQIEESKKDMVPRSRLNDKNDEIKELKEEIKQRDKQILTLEQSVKGNDELTKQLDELKQTNEGWEKKYNETQLNNAIKLAVAKTANDANDLLYFIKKDGLELQEDGTVKGLDETLTALKESKPYLFVSETPVLKGKSPNLDVKAPTITANPWERGNINLSEQARIMREDVSLAKQLINSAGFNPAQYGL